MGELERERFAGRLRRGGALHLTASKLKTLADNVDKSPPSFATLDAQGGISHRQELVSDQVSETIGLLIAQEKLLAAQEQARPVHSIGPACACSHCYDAGEGGCPHKGARAARGTGASKASSARKAARAAGGTGASEASPACKAAGEPSCTGASEASPACKEAGEAASCHRCC